MLESLMRLLSLVGGIARTGSKERVREAGELLSLAVRLYGAGSLTVQKLQQIETMVQAMVSEDRGPTPAERAALDDRDQDADDRINSVVLPGDGEGDDANPETPGVENPPTGGGIETPPEEVDNPNFNPLAGIAAETP